ncbi:hypothetical protein ACTL6U_11640 [Rhodovibrionaceae bacterium A322]
MAHTSFVAPQSTLTHDIAAFSAKVSSALASRFGKLTESMAEEHKRDRMARALHGLNERQLQDIGISHSAR